MSHRDLTRPAEFAAAPRRRGADLQEIAWDLLATTGGFLMVVSAVVLAVHAFSVG